MSEVVVRGLSRHYQGVAAVNQIYLQVADGEFVTLLGPSGCGKTTTLRCIAGLDVPDQGQIQIGSEVVNDAARQWVVPAHRRRLGMVFQSYALWPHMNVRQNIAYALRLQGMARAAAAERVQEMLALVDLAGYGEREISQLSGGQQQRVALARALAARPRVLLLDEPLSNLDASLRASMRRELRRIHRETGTTTLYVTHDQLEALTLSDRVIVMQGGRVQQNGTPVQVFSAPANRWVAEFVGFDNFLPASLLGSAAADDGEVAIRSTSFRAEPCAGALMLEGRVLESLYMGGPSDVTLDAQGHRVTARLHLAVPPAAGTTLALYLPPHEAVTLGAAV